MQPVLPLIVGTAGHIDHGKTSLVHRLTGMNPDRLPEELERGITIDLGFALLRPRSGLALSFVDVPGHEKFVKNMLAGATGMDAVLFIVAADEGLMPQSREHFDIVRLLGIPRIIAVITKIDLVDQEMRELVRLELEDYLEKALGTAPPIVEVSSRTGEGLDALTEELSKLAGLPSTRASRGAPRLSIDRKFVLQGHGTVVTGTQVAGHFRLGDAVEILPSGLKSRIRELQSHGQTVDSTGPGERVALNLHGVGLDELARGDVISHPGALESASILNAQVELLPSSPLPLERRTRVRVHLGAAEVLARVEPLEAATLEPGHSGLVQLRLESPAVAVSGQRFILRRYSPAITIGGGTVCECPAPKLTLESHPDLRPTRLLSTNRASEVALGLALRRAPQALGAELLRKELYRRGLPEPAEPVFPGLVVLEGGQLLIRENFELHHKELLDALAEYHKAFPLEPGSRPELFSQRSLAALEPATLQALLATLVRRGELVTEQDRFRLPDFAPLLDEASEARLLSLVETLDREGPLEEELWLQRLLGAGAKPMALHQYLTGQGQVLRMDGFVLGRKALGRLLSDCQSVLASTQGMGVAQLRDKTGWSRKLCIPFLELTDGLQLTRRRGDVRIAGPRLRPFLENIIGAMQ